MVGIDGTLSLSPRLMHSCLAIADGLPRLEGRAAHAVDFTAGLSIKLARAGAGRIGRKNLTELTRLRLRQLAAL